MANKVYEEIDNKINDLIVNRNKEIEILKKQIEESTSAKDKAEQEVVKATKTTDKKSFISAKKNFNDSKDIIEMLTGRLSALESNATVSDADGAAMVESVRVEQENALNSLLAELKPLLNQIDEVGEKYMKVIQEGNDLIEKWHREVRVFNKQIGTKDGRPYYVNSAPVFEGARGVRNYLDFITQNAMYRNITGKEKQCTRQRRFTV